MGGSPINPPQSPEFEPDHQNFAHNLMTFFESSLFIYNADTLHMCDLVSSLSDPHRHGQHTKILSPIHFDTFFQLIDVYQRSSCCSQPHQQSFDTFDTCIHLLMVFVLAIHPDQRSCCVRSLPPMLTPIIVLFSFLFWFETCIFAVLKRNS